MRLLPNEEDEVLTVAERWKAQYSTNGAWSGSLGDGKAIYDRLKALRRGATAKDVEAIIGNETWVGQRCTECGQRPAVILLGEEPDYESSTVWLCAKCLERARELLGTVDAVRLSPGEPGVPTRDKSSSSSFSSDQGCGEPPA